MAILTASAISRTGVQMDTADVAADVAGDSWVNTGKEFLCLTNADSSSTTVTLVYAVTTDGQAVANRTVAVAAGKTKFIGPFPVSLYNSTSTNRCSVTYSSVVSLTVAVLSLAPE